MKKLGLIGIGFVFLLAIMTSAGMAEEVKVRGVVSNLGIPEFTWDNATFPGFYYDIDTNMGTERMTFSLSNADPASATLSDQVDANGFRGVVYTTMAQPKNFKFKPWGQYEVIGFLADRYFDAYDPTVTVGVTNAGESVAFLYDKSKNRNLMTNEQLSKILIDDNTEMLISSSTPLKLEEGYELALNSINANETKVILDLKKDGQVVDTKIIQPGVDGARMADKTYYYRKNIGSTNDIVTIAVHFKNVFHGSDKDSATIDGIFQISDEPVQLNPSQQYDKMSIRNVDAIGMTITMDNKDNQITLSKNKDIQLMGKIHIKTADQGTITADFPLRYYLYSEEPCKCN